MANIGSGAITGAAVGGMVAHGPGAIAGAIIGAIGGAFDTKTVIKVRLSEEGYEWLNETRGAEFYPYEIIGGNSEEGIGEDEHLYLKTTGMVQIYVACDNCNGINTVTCTTCKGKKKVENNICGSCEGLGYIATTETEGCVYCFEDPNDLDNDGNKKESINKIKYYDSTILDKIYKEEYKALLDKGNECIDENEKKIYHDYADSVLKYLKKCYTYGGEISSESGQKDCIAMYSERKENGSGSDVEYVNESNLESVPNNLWEWIKDLFGNKKDSHVIREIEPYDEQPNNLQNIFYSEKVAQYATPVELMLNLLEISQSKDFVNSFIETVGNDNYIKLKLYTMRNKEVHFISEDFTRETTIEATREIEYVAAVTAYDEDGQFVGEDYFGSYDWKSIEGKGLDVGAKVTPDKDGSTIKIELTGDDKNNGYIYQVTYWIDGEENRLWRALGTDKAWWGLVGGYEGEVTLYVTPLWKNEWNDSSRVIRTREVTNITDQYYAAISEIKTWYGSYKATNTVDRSYQILKRTEATLESNEDDETSFAEVDGKGVINVMHRDSFQAKDLYELLVKEGLDIKAVEYSKVENWNSNWKTTTTYNSDDKIDIIDYDQMSTDGVYTEEDIRDIQLSYIMQTKEANKDTIKRKYSYDELTGSKYKPSSVTQTDTGLKVIDIKMSYTETINEGIMDGQVVDGVVIDGDVITTDDCIYTFLGLLSNKAGEYKLGEKFYPQLSGGKLVEYDDLYGDKTKVGALLENGEEMLYALLEESTRTQGLVPVMRYAMYLYKNNDFEVYVETPGSWPFNIFIKEKMESTIFNKEEMKPV